MPYSSYTITARGRAVLKGPTAAALARHARDLLALCDPQVRLVDARQFMPPQSLQHALDSLEELGLVEPAAPAGAAGAGGYAISRAGTA